MPNKSQASADFAGAYLTPEQKRRLRALALLRGQTQSEVLRDLIDRAPIEEKHNGGKDSQPTAAVAAG